MAGHTPGPWHAGHIADDASSCNCRSVVSEAGYFGAICTICVENSAEVGSISVADGYNDAPPLDEAKANARLIAAAPELLTACKAFVAMLDDSLDGFPKDGEIYVAGESDVEIVPDGSLRLSDARAAIAKAEGTA